MLRPAAVSASSKTKSPDHSHNTANLIGVAMLCLLKYCNAVSIQVSFECWRPMENKLEIKENKLIHSHQSFFCPPLPLYKSSMGMGVSTSWGRKRRTEALGAEREGGRGGKRERERERERERHTHTHTHRERRDKDREGKEKHQNLRQTYTAPSMPAMWVRQSRSTPE